MGIQKIKFKSKSYNYSIIIGKSALNVLPKKIKLLCPKTKNIAFIVDKKVPLKFIKNLRNKLNNYNLFFLLSLPMKKINLSIQLIFS